MVGKRMTQAEPMDAPPVDDNPYVGPHPFGRNDEPKLFGRDEEIRELLAMITASPITVIYAQSGAGKTSILSAKILPLLARRPCEVLPSTLSPVRVASPATARSKVKNIYTFHALRSLSPNEKPSSSQTLTQYLADLPKPEARVGIRMPRVLAFDQFEELFSRYPERWANRAEFFEDIATAIDEDPRLRVVFAMREEFIASFDSYGSNLPAHSVSRFHLERLRRAAARDAIVKPVENTTVFFTDRAVNKLLDKLLVLPSAADRGRYEEFVEPMHLQLVCYNLWRRRGGSNEIDSAAIKVLGDVDRALRDYFDSCIAEIVDKSRANVRAGTLRSWIEQKFITADGKRAMVYKGVAETEGIPNAIIDELERMYVIRTEPRGESFWCELAHERFVQPILTSNGLWRGRADATNRMTAIELKAGSWARFNRNDQYLIGGAELKRAQQWLASEAVAEVGISRNVQEFVARSAAVQQRREARRTRLWILFLILLVISAGALTLYFLQSSKRERAERYRVQNALALAHREVAEVMLVEERPLDALAWSVRAVAAGKLNETTATLRKALAAAGTTRWLRRPTAPTTIELSFDAQRAVTVSRTEMCVWELGGGGNVRCVPAPPKQLWFTAQFSRGGTFIVATSVLADDVAVGAMSIWRSDGSPVSKNVQRSLDHGTLLAVCDQKDLVVTLKSDEFLVFNAASGNVLGRRRSTATPQVDISRDCSRLGVNGDDPPALWEVPTLRGLRTLADQPMPYQFVKSIEFDETGQRIVVLWKSSIVASSVARVYSIDGTLLGSVNAGDGTEEVRPVRNGTELATAAAHAVSFIDVRSGKTVASKSLAGASSKVLSRRRFVTEVAETPNGTRIVTYDRDSRSSQTVEIEEKAFDAAVVSDDGLVVMTQKGNNIRVWNARTPKLDIAALNHDQLFEEACRQLDRNGYVHADVAVACRRKSSVN
jgi:WD40 repeat protein